MSEVKTDTSIENPIQVKELNAKIGGWIHRLGAIHVEGQITEFKRRGSGKVCFMTLRDPSANASISVTTDEKKVPEELVDGAHVVIEGKPQFWQGRGTLQMRATVIHLMGEGDLLAKVDRTRRTLKGEGLFDQEHKKPLPFLPRKIGLITGSNSHAEQDVLTVTEKRWPGMAFSVKHVRVQGRYTVKETTDALRALDNDPNVEVIIIARGGGSVEDLLPFSDETLVRAVFDCGTPVISAIGHQPDCPILDDVADVRAATPTDAAKRVVPDRHNEVSVIENLDSQAHQALSRVLDSERTAIHRDVAYCMQYPQHLVERERTQRDSVVREIDRLVVNIVRRERDTVASLGALLESLNPNSVLDRGYAVVKSADGVISTVTDLAHAAYTHGEIEIQFARGSVRIPVTMEGMTYS